MIEKMLTHLGLQASSPPPCIGPWTGAASGLNLPSRDSSGDPGDQGRSSGMCPGVVGADGCGWTVRGNLRIAFKNDVFRLVNSQLDFLMISG